MAVTWMCGFEGGNYQVDGTSNNAYYDTTTVRTGARSKRYNVASGGTNFVQPAAGTAPSNNDWVHFGMYLAARPSGRRVIWGSAGTGHSLAINSDGTLSLMSSSTVLATSSAALNATTWYWIGLRQATSAGSVVWVQIDGTDAITGTYTIGSITHALGPSGSEAVAIDVYFDDWIYDGAGFLAPSKCDVALPISDSARGTGWVGGAGGTTNLYDAVNNTPPVGVADTGTNTSQNRNATASANSNYDANMETYTTLGVNSDDTVLAVRPVVTTAAPVSTSAKQGTIGASSNPTITNISLGSGGTAGAFWSGVAGGTYPTGWKTSWGTLTTSPSVTLGSSPVLRITQVTSSTRIAMVCFMGLLVAWTPAAAVTGSMPYIGGGYYP